MPRQVGSAYVEFSARTGKVVSGMEAAKAATRKAMQEMKRDVKEAKGSMALLGDEIGVKLPRHLQTFVAKLPGVASALSSAFSGIAVVGLGLIVVEQIEKIHKAMEAMAEAPKKIADAFDKEKESIAESTDELRLQNVQLQNAINKFKGVPENKLAEQLAEATVQAVKLGSVLLKVDDQIQKILADNKVGMFAKLMGVEGMDDIKEKITEYQDEQQKTKEAWDAKIRADEAAKNKTQLDADTKAKNDALEEQTKNMRGWIVQQQTLAEQGVKRYQDAQKHWFTGAFSTQLQDPSARLSALVGIHGELTAALDNEDEELKNVTLHEEKAGETGLSAAEKLKKAQEEEMRRIKAIIDSNKQNYEFQQRLTDSLTETWLKSQHEQQEEDKRTEELRKQHTAEFIADEKEKHDAAVEVQKSIAQAASDDYALTAQDEATKVEMAQESNTQRIANLQTALAERERIIQQSFVDEEALFAGDVAKQEEIRRAALKESADYARQSAALQREAMTQGITGALLEMERKAMDTATTIRDIFTSMINGINDEWVKMLTGQRTNWRQMFGSVAGQAAKSGLTTMEGMAMKALGIGSKPDGSTSSKALWTKSADNIKKAGSDIANVAKGSPDPSTAPLSGFAGWLSSKLGGGGIFGSILKAFMPMQHGGPVIPGAAYLVGERGPEPFFPGVSGSIGTNAAMHRAFAGAGSVSHSVNVDARGTSDPAMVTAAVHRAMRSYMPTMVAASAAFQQDTKRRTPTIAHQ